MPVRVRPLSLPVLILMLLLGMAVSAPGAHAAAGALDPTFNGDGSVTTPVGTGDDFANAVAVQPDGKIVVAGFHYLSLSDTDFVVARYTRSGVLDPTFSTDGIVTTSFGAGFDHAQAVAIQPDGKIVVAGASFNGDFALARYTTTGGLDSSFDGDGKVTTPIASTEQALAMALQPDGKIVAAGWSIVGSTYDFAAARYTTTGALDPSFDVDGTLTTPIGSADDLGRAVAVESDGDIVVAGSSETGTNDEFAVARYSPSGALDPTFDGDGKVVTPIGSFDDFGNDVALQADGKVVVAGSSQVSGVNSDFALARYTTSGALDPAFDTDGKVTTAFGLSTDIADGLAIQADGKILAGGYFFTGSAYDLAIARYTSAGAPDSSFDLDGKATAPIGASHDYSYGMTLQPDGRILLAGASAMEGTYDLALARFVNDPPALSISDASRTEGDAGSANMTFTVSVALPGQQAPGDVTVHYSTGNGTATAPADYAARSGTLTFAVGETTKTITIPVKGDLIDEPAESFYVHLSSPSGGVIANGTAEGTINDNDPTPALSVSDTTVTEGNSGTTYATFTMSLTNPKSDTITVDFETSDGTATAPSDYAARSGTKVFLPGQTTKTVSVAVRGETVQEPDETFFLNLLDPDGATIADGQGIGTIADDDRPTISINDKTVTETNGTTTVNMVFNVTLSKAGTSTVTVQYATANGTAVAPGDYTAKSGTLTFSVGQTSKTITIVIRGDNLDEPNETFFVNLSNATNATIADPQGMGTITDND
jgi:uncharacterized delta-60 repeat protein